MKPYSKNVLWSFRPSDLKTKNLFFKSVIELKKKADAGESSL